MALSTFGAIMGFAAEIVRQATEAYEKFLDVAKSPELKIVLQQLAAEEQKNYTLMERTRREHVTEMILEPITGLFKKDYEVNLSQAEQKDDTHLVSAALKLETRGKRFFEDASVKVPLPEVARIFRKVAKKKEENLQRLQGIRSAQK